MQMLTVYIQIIFYVINYELMNQFQMSISIITLIDFDF